MSDVPQGTRGAATRGAWTMSKKVVSIEWTGDPTSAVRSMQVIEETSSKTAQKSEASMTKAAGGMGGAFKKLDGLLAGFGIPFTGALTSMGEKMEATAEKGEAEGASLMSVWGTAGLGIAAVAVGIGVESIHLADKFETAHAQLQNSLKNTGQTYASVKNQVSATDAQGEKYGYTITETEGALAKANTALGSNVKASQAVQLAWNISAKTGKDFTASLLLAEKGMEGNSNAFNKAGIQLPIVTGGAKQLMSAQQSLTKAQEAGRLVEEKIQDGRLKGIPAQDAQRAAYIRIMDAQQKVNDVGNAGNLIYDAATQKFKGAADASAKTFAGSMKSLSATLQDVGIKIGLFLIPYVQKLSQGLAQGIQWIEAHKADFKKFFDDVAGAVKAAWTIMEPIYKALWEQLQGAFNLIDDLVHGQWSNLWGDFVAILKAALDLIVAPFVGLYHLFQSTFDNIANAASTAVSNTVSWFAGLPDRVLGAVGNLAGTLVSAGYDLISGMWSGMKSAWNWLADKMTINVGGGSVFGVDLPSVTVHFLPHLAAGTKFFAGGLAMVGEQGPELVALPKGSQVFSAAQTRDMAGGGDTHITVNAPTNAKPSDIAAAVGWALRVA
jgi:hypothetical protein